MDDEHHDETRPVPAAGELTGREAQIAQGISLLEQGNATVREAAATSGVARATLHDAYARLRPGPGGREAALKAMDERILDHAAVISEGAAAKLAEAIYTDQITDHKQLAIVGGIYLDKLSKLRGYEKAAGTGAGAAMDAVLERLSEFGLEAEVSIRPVSPDRRAVDVTPQKPCRDEQE